MLINDLMYELSPAVTYHKTRKDSLQLFILAPSFYAYNKEAEKRMKEIHIRNTNQNKDV